MSIIRQVEAVRRNLGLWTRDTHTVLQFSGTDAGAWLQAQTSNDVLRLASGQGCWNALLDRQGRVLALFTCHRWEDEYWLLLPREQVPAIQARMESHLFLEEVHGEDVGASGLHIQVEGPRSVALLARLMEAPPEEAANLLPQALHSFHPLRLLGREVLAFRQTDSGEDGYLLIPAPEEAQELYADLLDHSQEFLAVEVEPPAQRALRFEGGLGDYGVEIAPETVISETPYEAVAVAYDKGCFLGQEVVQRIKSYGSPKYALMGLLAAGEAVSIPELPAPLFAAGRKVGELRSAQWAPWRSAWMLRAYLDRTHRMPGQSLEVGFEPGEAAIQVQVLALPFYAAPAREQAARQLYQEALAAFEDDAGDEDSTAIELLEESLLLAPDFEDAYEALGVILHRHHRVDEAITWMRRLERLNPNSVMAHSNLSVFYVAKGMIQEAETEKAKAAHLQSRHQLDSAAAEKTARQEREQIRREAEERIGLFREVLELDPEDPVATMGLGRCYVQLEEFAQALPWFEAATSARKDYSAAYLEWGKALEVLGRLAEAVPVYRQGIEAAGRKGDLMPLREMERRLKSLSPPSLPPIRPGGLSSPAAFPRPALRWPGRNPRHFE